MPQSYLAFDLGASSGRAVVGTLEDGRLKMQEVHRFPTPITETSEHLFWNLEALWREVTLGIRKASAAAPDVCSASVDSWAVDYVPLDAEGRPLRDPVCYRDSRTRGLLPEVFGRVSAAELYARTGIQMMEINTSVQMVAEVGEEAEFVQRASRRLFIADYLHFRMSGRAVAERTMASTSQLMNIETGQWDVALMQRLGIPDDQWPEIVPPGTRLGTLRLPSDDGADYGVEVIAGCCHDTAAAVAAVPAAENGPAWAYISSGTWSLLGAECMDAVVNEAARAANFTNEAGLDGSVRFLKNLTGLWVLQECERSWRDDGHSFTYDELMDDARRAPAGSRFINLDDPRFSERGGMVNKIADYCSEHGIRPPDTPGETVRLILESLAHNYARTLDSLDELTGQTTKYIHIVGGGARNALLCQWTADACGRTVLAGPAEATVIGNLLVQARTLGDLPEDTSIREIVRAGCEPHVYEPFNTYRQHLEERWL